MFKARALAMASSCLVLHSLIILPSLQFAIGESSHTAHVVAIRRQGSPSEFLLGTGGWAHNSAAAASFRDDLHTTGWGILNIETNSAFTDLEQAYAAGMVEGFLTAQHIYTTQLNLYPNVFGANVSGVDQVSPRVKEFMDRQEAWARVMVSERAPMDPFWAHVGNVMVQLDGLIAGYAVAAQRGLVPRLDRFAFQMLNGVGDLFDIIPAVNRERRTDWLSLSLEAAELMHASRGHCSGLVKLTGDFSDLFMAHSSWFTYSNTDRIFKHYFFNYSNPATAARRISFSSYPGFLNSLDDFYLLDSGLSWIQTTNTVVDHSVYDEVKPESLLAWQRVRVASAMAHSGREWYELLKRHFSGTYANQYMIVDFKLFEPMKPLKPNTLWIVEEMPGLVVGGDKTDTLSRGYWPSYNVPFWPEIYKKSGYHKVSAKHGNYFTYELCPRAKLYRRDQANVSDMESLKTFMRYNDYLRDSYSLDSKGLPNPTYAICSRGDLHSTSPSADGCYDTKVTSYNHGAMRQRAQAINGPTHSTRRNDLPPFSWSRSKFAASQSHLGLPDTYSFDFVDVHPEKLGGFPVSPEAAGVVEPYVVYA